VCGDPYAPLAECTPYFQERQRRKVPARGNLFLPGTVTRSVRWRFEFHEHETEVDMGLVEAFYFGCWACPSRSSSCSPFFGITEDCSAVRRARNSPITHRQEQ
jgi:hypothetical protein